jgi:hypothetical protein
MYHYLSVTCKHLVLLRKVLRYKRGNQNPYIYKTALSVTFYLMKTIRTTIVSVLLDNLKVVVLFDIEG